MKLIINKVPLGKQTMKYHLMKYQIYSNYKTIIEETQGTRIKYCITQLTRIELRLKKSLMMLNYYYTNNNSLVFIGLPRKWNKSFNRFLVKKDNCFLIYMNKKTFSKLTYDQFLVFLNNRLIKANKGKPLLIVNFWGKWDCQKISDIPVINFDITNNFTLSLLEASLRAKPI